MKELKITQNKSKQFFKSVCKYIYVLGSPDYWFESSKASRLSSVVLDSSPYVTNIIITLFIMLEWGALYTQKNLSEKQVEDLKMFCVSHPILLINALYLHYQKHKVREVLCKLVVKFKDVYNDPEVEIQMLRKAKIYTGIMTLFSAITVTSYGLDGFLQFFTKDKTFTTVITAYPEVTDKSLTAELARAVMYVVWWVFLVRLTAVYWIIIPVTVCINHHFKTLCSYFYSLSDIFETNQSQEEKEKQYEQAFIFGIKLHSETLLCVRQFQDISQIIFGGQMLLSISCLSLLMVQTANSEHTTANAVMIVSLGGSVCLSTGCLMWAAGDITEEAARLSSAMFESGWHNCHLSTKRIRPLLVIAMTVSQKPVILRAFGVIAVSYSSYVTIVKTSYSVFSVIYY